MGRNLKSFAYTATQRRKVNHAPCAGEEQQAGWQQCLVQQVSCPAYENAGIRTDTTDQTTLYELPVSGVLLILRSDRICLPVMQIGCKHAPGACSIACALTSIIDHLSALASAKYFESEDKSVLLTGSFFSCTENRDKDIRNHSNKA